ncbi:MAG TPA: tetratricopeptide repeat protein [Thermoanaerobaculia bacterium]|nr:tetratricopeptide repeat protein [Thermoanaerobaculia bacterium]
MSCLLTGGLLSAGCTQYKPFDSAGFLRGEFRKQVGPELAGRIEVPFQLDEQVRAAFKAGIRRAAPNEPEKVTQVLDYIFDRLHLEYAQFPTRSATAAFRERKGNCLSFVNLFVGLAREEEGLNPFYVEVTDYQRWNHQKGLVISAGHIVAGMYLDGELKTYDFLPYRPKEYKQFHPIDDLGAVAHYYNNLGAEALISGDLAAARKLLTLATEVAPRFDKGFNNLGVCLARGGELDHALEIYRRGLEIDPGNLMILTNMARAYQELGRVREAAELLARIEGANTTNPYFYVYQGEMALARGETAKALDYMVRALRLDTETPEVHLGLVKVYLALGDREKARHFLDRALKLNATDKEALKYARMLGK